jgi:murein DD-endopeptidase MepM/ murein hydrolase activator NlpD
MINASPSGSISPQTLNVYRYSRNNPIRFVDPTGFADEENQSIDPSLNISQPTSTPADQSKALEQDLQLQAQANAFYNPDNIQRAYEPRNGGSLHKGADYEATPGETKIPAPVSGKIVAPLRSGEPDGIYVQGMPKAGNIVSIRTPDGSIVQAFHLQEGSNAGLHSGQTIQRGEMIGVSGTSGNMAAGETDPHVHIQRMVNGQAVPDGTLIPDNRVAPIAPNPLP